LIIASFEHLDFCCDFLKLKKEKSKVDSGVDEDGGSLDEGLS
jgi:hypothetical protein